MPSDRTEKPTSRRLRQAREKGQVARSKEISSAASLISVLLTLSFFGPTVIKILQSDMQRVLTAKVPSDITITYISALFASSSLQVGIVVLPIMIIALVFSVGSNALQGGFIFTTEALGIHFEKFSPKSGLERIFSKNGLVELAKSLVLILVVSFLSYQVIVKYMPIYPRLILMDVQKLFHWITAISYEIFIRVAVLLVIVAIGDYFFQKYRFTEQLKMTKQEVKEDFKEQEGDPLIKGRIRRIQREMARKRMMADVPNADVIITNPTHYAVALSYKMDSMEAPKVVAKGVGFLALKIRELAQKHDIPIVENRPLAQNLYKNVEVGDYIPGHLYRAVAEILAYIYKAKSMFRR
jgi:flagellar biosynthetic protein FlhB